MPREEALDRFPPGGSAPAPAGLRLQPPTAPYNPRQVTKALLVLYLLVILIGIGFYVVIGGMHR